MPIRQPQTGIYSRTCSPPDAAYRLSRFSGSAAEEAGVVFLSAFMVKYVCPMTQPPLTPIAKARTLANISAATIFFFMFLDG